MKLRHRLTLTTSLAIVVIGGIYDVGFLAVFLMCGGAGFVIAIWAEWSGRADEIFGRRDR